MLLMSAFPAKHEKVIETVRAAISGRKVFFTEHADQRMGERSITASEIRYVLLNGYHEVKKDQFNGAHQEWDYAIRGKTADERVLRIVIAISSPGIIVVTAIDLEGN